MHDQDGFRDFVLARGGALSRSAYLLTGDHHLAEDLLQTALTRCAAHWRRVASGDPEAYVRRTMINERTSRWRRRRYTLEVSSDVAAGRDPIVAGDVADQVVAGVTIMAALAQLPARQRAVIVLRFFDDMTETAAAELLGCAVGTVKSQTHAALKRLRALAPELLSEISAEPSGAPEPVAKRSLFARPEVEP